MAKVKQSPSELQSQLNDQLQFLEASAARFDEGHDNEAKRLAATIRLLVHDTPKSHSLLGQLELKGGPFWDTAFKAIDENRAGHGGLVFIAMGGAKTRYVAMLDAIPPPYVRQVPFDRWWSAPVFVDAAGRRLTRSDLVLAVANQDGGAHVDPGLEETYAALSRNNSLNYVANDGQGERAMDGPERAALRQIAHELLKTLKPGYSANPQHSAALIASTFTITQESVPPILTELQAKARKVGRNAPCPCGSGKKSKRCHGAVGP